MTPEERAILIEVITYHYMDKNASCGCGWAELGKSQPAHVVDVFEQELQFRKEGK